MSPDQGATRRRSALESALGVGVAQYLQRGDVLELLVNADGVVWVDAIDTGMTQTELRLTETERETAIRLLAHEAGETIGRDRPMLATVLPSTAARVQAILPPLAEAPVLSIRKRPARVFSIGDYLAHGRMSDEDAATLRKAVAARKNIVVAGGTGAGKTTLLNALLAEDCFRSARVVILEDTAELQCESPNRVQLLTKRTPPLIDMRDLVRITLRLRPDRIVVGEVRDGAALEVLKAWNTGHPGGLLTLHANSANEALSRLEDLIAEVSAGVMQRLVRSAVDVIVFMRRGTSGWRVAEIVSLR